MSEVILQKISFVQEKLNVSKEYLNDYKNSDTEKDLEALERVVEQIVETSIKINKELLNKINIFPLSYKESFLKLEKLNLFEKNFLKILAKTATFRNELAHDYINMSSFYSLENIELIIKNYPKYLIQIIDYLDKK